jgi:hypothetical protein
MEGSCAARAVSPSRPRSSIVNALARVGGFFPKLPADQIRERTKYGAVQGGIEITSDDDRQRTVKIRIGGKASHRLCLRDSIIVVGGLELQARDDHV